MPSVTPLSAARCERLLRAGVFGRVAFQTPSGPEIVPVNYAVLDDAIVIRTEPTSLLGKHADGQSLVFEIDLVDYPRWQGWSVVAKGTGQRLATDDLGPPTTRPRPWADGQRTVIVRLAWTELSGRRLGSGHGELSALPVRQVLS
jgi:nitroimidazol reductase NimA-like FMN-containing flavoprotein (pyridoxamine 5'-phosphate oxidase superfamily)